MASICGSHASQRGNYFALVLALCNAHPRRDRRTSPVREGNEGHGTLHPFTVLDV
jgi:hypothetical protein